MCETNIEFIEKLSVLELKPDDLIVIKHPVALSRENGEQLALALRSALNKVGIQNKIIVLDEGMDIGILRGVSE